MEQATTPALPGFPRIESPLFAPLLAEGHFGVHGSAAQQLHGQGYVLVDLGRERMAALAARIQADLAGAFDLEAWRAAGAQGDLRVQDGWRQSEAVRELALLPELLGLLEQLWGRRPFAFQTFNDPVGNRQPCHSDAVHFHSEPAGFLCGVWVALEDIHADAGPLEYYPGSQRLPYLQARDVGYRQQPGVTPDQAIFQPYWQAVVQSQGLERQLFTPRLGQALIWSANLLHGGAPVANPALTRWSQVTHYLFEGCRWYTPLLSDWPTGPVAWLRPLDVATGRAHQLLKPEEMLEELHVSGLFDAAWYAAQYGLQGSVRELLFDYLQQDIPRLRRPNPWFDPEHYCTKSADVQQEGIEPLLHFLRSGWKERRPTLNGCSGADVFTPDQRACLVEPLFWREWYLTQLPQGTCEPDQALDHYLRLGVMTGRDPNPLFHGGFYARQCPGLLEEGVFPLVHYLLHGWQEGLRCHWLFDGAWLSLHQGWLSTSPALVRFLQGYLAGERLQPSPAAALPPPHPAGLQERWHQLKAYAAGPPPQAMPEYQRAIGAEPLSDLQALEELPAPLASRKQPNAVIAFYLPQFHCIPENDLWWGSGFTEWTNLRRSRPLFVEHRQPRDPHVDVGYYNLDDLDVFPRQIAMARRYGVEGFCFYHYWFNGRRLLERPVQQWLSRSELDFPFCLCWANETWSRRWDGRPHDVLIEQQYAADYVERFAADLMPALMDPRYIRWDGRPVVLVYRVLDLPDPLDFSRRFRAVVRDALGLELELLSIWSFDLEDPIKLGFDGAVQFPPLQVPTPDLAHQLGLSGPRVFGYPEAIRHGVLQLLQPRSFPLHAGVCPSWDNTPRRGAEAVIWLGATPERFAQWLRLAQRFNRGRALFINAWNEWGEGCQLEPDQCWGYQWLEAIASLPRQQPKRKTLLVIAHDADRAGSQILLLRLLQAWARRGDLAVRLLLADGGVLLDHYRRVVDVRLLDRSADLDAWRQQLIEALGAEPDLIYANTVLNGPLVEEIRRMAERPIPVVCHVHELQAAIERWAPGAIMAATLRATDHYIAVSEPVRRNLLERHGVEPEAVAMIPAFIHCCAESFADSARRQGLRNRFQLSPDAVVILGCGTLDWRKGVDLFVETARLVTAQRPEVVFVWIGRVTPDALVQPADLSDLGLLGKLLFAGEHPDAQALMPMADLFFLSSREDPFPLVALEAADAGLALIAFAESGGIPDLIANGGGLVVPHADVKAASQAIIDLVVDAERRQDHGLAARENVQAFDADRLSAQLAGVVLEVASRT